MRNLVRKCITLVQIYATSKSKLKQIHAFSIRRGIPLTSLDWGKLIIYTNVSLSGPMSYSHNIFTQIKNPNDFTYNTMIRGYAESEEPEPAARIYKQMSRMNIEPDTHTYPFLCKAVAKLSDVRLGEMIHCVVVKNGFESLVFVRNGLIHMYGLCGKCDEAHKVFELMRERDVVAWNSVINGYAINGKPNEALRMFQEMCFECVKPDGFTMVSVLSACAELGALALGSRVHTYMVKIGTDKNMRASNSLLDLYAKCGSIREARKVFDDMEEKDVVSWTSLIVGLAINGFGDEALDVYREMDGEGFVPSDITFIGVLYACSHCGMVDEGFNYFRKMKEHYGISPKIEHFGCMVDLLARAGRVKDAYDYIQDMPMKPNDVIWRTLLSACTVHGHLELGELARVKLLEFTHKHCGDYVLLSNLYASEKRWSDVHNLRTTMHGEGVRKTPGHSFVELGNRIHEFLMGDRTHPQTEAIYAKLTEMSARLKLEGYVPRTSNVLVDIQEEEKEDALVHHSEKIAIAFVLLNTPPRTPIRVMKNLRVCGDCHLAIKLISKVYDREIVVRDLSRFHHFRNGSCSCKDYW